MLEIPNMYCWLRIVWVDPYNNCKDLEQTKNNIKLFPIKSGGFIIELYLGQASNS